MPAFSEYVIATGIPTGRTSTSSKVQPAEGCALYQGYLQPDLDRVDAQGNKIAIDPATLAAYQSQPPNMTWDRVNEVWVDLRPQANILAEAKTTKIAAIKADAIARMPAVIQSLGDLELFGVFRELWLSIAPAARSPTTTLATAIAVYQSAATGIAAVRAASTIADVQAVIVNWP